MLKRALFRGRGGSVESFGVRSGASISLLAVAQFSVIFVNKNENENAKTAKLVTQRNC